MRVKILQHKHLIPRLSRIAVALMLAAIISAAPAATNTVVNANSTGNGSLRLTISSAASGDTINFAAGLAGQSIVLTNGQLTLNKDLIIDASALPGGIQISGNQASRVFEVTPGTVATLKSLTIRDGYAPSGTYPANAGGGILNRGTLTLTNCTVANNQAVQGSTAGGGGIENSSATLIVNNSTITGNAGGAGGGIESYVSGPGGCTLNQCTVTGNSATSYGGGLYNFGLTTVNQSTVTGNSAANSGGGIANYSTLNVFNSIVAGNTSSGNVNISGSYSPSGVNRTSGDPLLAPLDNYGGPTQTRLPLPGSPAIDGCTNGTTFTTDQRGFPRPVGLRSDIGAVEGVAPIMLTSPTRLGNGSFRFGFTYASGQSYSVRASTNVALPLNAWSNLGAAVETPPGSGQFQFTDLQATNFPRRFYRVRNP